LPFYDFFSPEEQAALVFVASI